MKFKKDINVLDLSEALDGLANEGFEYALFEGGYIDPLKLLEGDDLKKVNEAMNVLSEFKKSLEEQEGPASDE